MPSEQKKYLDKEGLTKVWSKIKTNIEEIPSTEMIDFSLDTVSNVSGSYSHTTIAPNATADMKAVSLSVSNSAAFNDDITITFNNGSINLSCSNVVGSSQVVVTAAVMRSVTTAPMTSAEYNTLNQAKLDKTAFNAWTPSGNGSNDQILRSNGDGTTRWDNAATSTEIGTAVTNWLDTNVPTGTTVVVDKTLTVANAAAEAKETGDQLTDLKSALDYIKTPNKIDVTWIEDYYYNSIGALAHYTASNAKYWASERIIVTDYKYLMFKGSMYYKFIEADQTDTGLAQALDDEYVFLEVPSNVKWFVYSKETLDNHYDASLIGFVDIADICDCISDVENLNKQTVKGIGSLASASITDLNNIPNNTIYAIYSNGTYSNIPSGAKVEKAIIVTFSPDNDNIRLQYYVTDEGNIYHRRSWNGTWTAWKTEANPVRGIGNLASEGITDFNNIPSNTIYAIYTNGTYSNAPSGVGVARSIIVTIAPDSDTIRLQFFIPESGEIYHRKLWGTTWTSWAIESKPVRGIGGLAQAGITDFNNIPSNTIYCIFVSGEYSNAPSGIDLARSTIVTLAPDSDTIKIQYIVYDNGEVYYRNLWGSSWTNWKNLNTKANPIQQYDKILCIGDSLTWGQVYTGDYTSRQAIHNYPFVIGRITGLESTYLASSGASPTTWWTAFNEDLIPAKDTLYIVFLGTNYGLSDTVDTDCPGFDITDYAENNTGYYGRILAKIYNAGAKAILVKPWVTAGGATLADTWLAIDDFSEKFQFAAISVPKNEALAYHYFPDKTGTNMTHFNDLGYTWLAEAVLDGMKQLGYDEQFKLLRPYEAE